MAILNYVKREIVAKIVYYGPGLSGKTLNIQKVHESMDPTNVGELTSLATESDRTLFFDFVPIQLGKIAGLETRFQLFTVPGQVFYNQTRRRVLEDCDGVVFVADSQPEQLENNLESLANLEENLAYYGKKLQDVPFVIQFNKQDLPGCMTEEELNKVLNKYNAPTIRASCVENFGVMETLAKISTMVLAHLREQMTKKTAPGAPPTGIKRTYSKEGVSDEQVVKNLLEDIANSGAAAEAQAAAGVAPKPAAPPPAPARPVAAPAAPKPVVPRPAAAPKPIVPGSAPPSAAAAAPTTSGGLSAEDLLSDLDAPAARTKPAAAPPKPITAAPKPAAAAAPRPAAAAAPAPRPAPAPAAAPAAPAAAAKDRASAAGRPAVAAPPKPAVAPPPPVGAPPPPATAPPPPGNGAGLRSVTPPPRPAPGATKTAEELLESMERSTDGGLEQESSGSFDTNKKKTGNPLWDADDEEPAPATASARATFDDLLGGNDDADGEREGKTSVGRPGLEPGSATAPMAKPVSKPAVAAAAAAALSGDEPETGSMSAELRVGSVGAPTKGADGSLEFDVQITDGTRDVPVRLVLPAALLKGVTPAKSGGGGALFLGIVNLLLVLGLAAFNVLTFLGVITR